VTARQAKFVAAYIGSGNAAEAARVAGYSARTARTQGARLLTNVHIAAAVAAGQHRVEEKLTLDADTIAAELAKVGFALTPLSNVGPSAKVQALVSLARMLGHWKEKQEPEPAGPSLVELIGGSYNPKHAERNRVANLSPADVIEECHRLHGNACVSIEAHADRCAELVDFPSDYWEYGNPTEEERRAVAEGRRRVEPRGLPRSAAPAVRGLPSSVSPQPVIDEERDAFVL